MVVYAENIDECVKNAEPGAITSVYVRHGTNGKYWNYFCDISKEVFNA